MSSFTIAKAEYIKAAGVVAGIADYYSRGIHNFHLWLDDRGRVKEPVQFHDLFSEIYRMNAESVAEQYGDKAAETDGCKYDEVFTSAMAFGKKALFAGKGRALLLELRDFFRSALYQTEKKEFSIFMELVFCRIVDQIVDLVNPREVRSWGELDLSAIVQII